MTRQPALRPEDLDPAQQRLRRRITEGPRARGGHFALSDADGVLQGPFGGFLLSPAVGDALQRLGAAVRYESGLGDRVRERAILAVAARWDSAFERTAHEAVARASGLSEEELAALRAGEAPALEDPLERASHRLVTALLDGDVDDATWEACVPPLTPGAVFELVTLVGYYATLALQMRVFRVDPPQGPS